MINVVGQLIALGKAGRGIIIEVNSVCIMIPYFVLLYTIESQYLEYSISLILDVLNKTIGPILFN